LSAKIGDRSWGTCTSALAFKDVKAGLEMRTFEDYSSVEYVKRNSIEDYEIYETYTEEFAEMYELLIGDKEQMTLCERLGKKHALIFDNPVPKEVFSAETELTISTYYQAYTKYFSKYKRELHRKENKTMELSTQIDNAEMTARLNAFSKSHLIQCFRVLNGGRLGFDGARKNKEFIIKQLLSRFSLDQLTEVFCAPGHEPDAVKPGGISALQDAIYEILGDGAMSRDEIQAMIQTTIHAQHKPKLTVEIKTADTTKSIEGHFHKAFAYALKLANSRVNILLIGPSGSGKTHLAEQVAKALDLPFASISITAGISESQLLGGLLPVEEGGRFSYTESSFIHAYENGGVFLLDELDSADPNTILSLNKALSGNAFHLPARFGDEQIKRHKNFICIGAINTMLKGADHQYSGRERQDEALVDRFKFGRMKLDYDTDLERQIIHPSVVEWGHGVRKVIKEKNLAGRNISTRFMIDCTKAFETEKLGQASWEYSFFMDWSADDMALIGRKHQKEGLIYGT